MTKLHTSRLAMAALFALSLIAACGLGSSSARADEVQDCMNGVGDYIKRNGLDVSAQDHRKALIVCERSGGNLKVALSVLPVASRADEVRDCINGVGEYIKRNGLDVSPDDLRQALIVCERSGGNLKVALGVLPAASRPSPPRIVAFRVDPSRVRPGGFVSFFWRVENATRVTLSDSFGVLEDSDELVANGTSSIALRKTTTFRLVAKNRRGQSAERTFTVRVTRFPRPTGPRPSDGCENLPPDQQDRCGG